MRLDKLLARKHEYRVLGLMLLVLHGAVWSDVTGSASRSLMLAHLGLFLLWQPIWRREERLRSSAVVVSVAVVATFIGTLDWGLMTVWMVLLIGIVGGRMTEGKRERTVYMLALIFLITELLIGAIPAMFEVRVPELVVSIIVYGLPALGVVIALVPPHESPQRSTQSVDFLYGLTVSLLVSVLAMGTLLRMYESQLGYPEAMFQTLIGLGCFLLAISWLWSPFAGFGGLGQLWTRYLMNIGTPFEQWLSRIADISTSVSDPNAFMDNAVKELGRLPWVRGARWEVNGRQGQVGIESEHAFSVQDQALSVTVYAHGNVGTALQLHGRLLVGILGHFYRAKTHEVTLTDKAHLTAVHETGARITHDIKNLLQSLYSLTSAIEGGQAARDKERFLWLLERQLPTVSQRLQLALDKLQVPSQADEGTVTLQAWWHRLRDRHATMPFKFEATLDANPNVPVELFDNVAENLLENARFKQLSEPTIVITVELEANASALEFRVRDSGKAAPKEIQEKLLRAPIKESSGLGIGLYQAAKLAEQNEFALQMTRMEDGYVEFTLRQLGRRL